MITLAEAHEHANVGFWADYLSVQFDPAHMLAELGFTLVFEAVQLFLIVWLWRKVIKPRLRREIHAEIDSEHGYTHTAKHSHEAVSGRLSPSHDGVWSDSLKDPPKHFPPPR